MIMISFGNFYWNINEFDNNYCLQLKCLCVNYFKNFKNLCIESFLLPINNNFISILTKGKNIYHWIHLYSKVFYQIIGKSRLCGCLKLCRSLCRSFPYCWYTLLSLMFAWCVVWKAAIQKVHYAMISRILFLGSFMKEKNFNSLPGNNSYA